MILSKEQINRYLRHIIIPEISGAGQKKITELKIFIASSTVYEASSLIYYLAATGVGYIYCSFEDEFGFEKLFSNVHDLNEQVTIKLISDKTAEFSSQSLKNENFSIKILLCKYKKLKDALVKLQNIKVSSDFIPSIIGISEGFRGYLQTFKSQEAFDFIFKNPIALSASASEKDTIENEGFKLSTCLLGALITIECIKLCLNIGVILGKPLCFDLLSMEFDKSQDKNFNLSFITDFLKNNYSKQALSVSQACSFDLNTANTIENNTKNHISMKPYNKKLSESKVLIVGTGGLGSPAAYALSSLGIGTIGLVDYDKVEISNLNRQILHSTSKIGMPKVQSAEEFIKILNPNVNVVTYNFSITENNVMDIIKDYDVVIDAVDNFVARYLLNDSCYFANKPLVDAAAVRFHGLIMTILPKEGHCYRCAFPVTPDQNGTMRCSEAGVLGPVPGVMGFMEAAETIKLLLNIGDKLSNKIIYYDALEADFDTIIINKSEACDLCGTNPTITSLVEYTNACENNKKP